MTHKISAGKKRLERGNWIVGLQAALIVIVLRVLWWLVDSRAEAAELSKTDWAAWIQAIGSIVAILAAIWVGWYQAQANEKARQRERDQGDHAAFVLCQELISDAESAVHKYVDAAKKRALEAGRDARFAHNLNMQPIGHLQQLLRKV